MHYFILRHIMKLYMRRSHPKIIHNLYLW